MFSWFKRNRVKKNIKNKKYINKFNEIKTKIMNNESLSDYDLNFIYHKLEEYDKYELIELYDYVLTFIVSNYLQKE